MIKSKRLIFKYFVGLIIFLFVSVLVLPFFFKGTIIQKVKKELKENLNAEVEFINIHLNLLSDFPNLSTKINGITVVGIDEFAGDTLVQMQSLRFSVNLVSLVNKMEGPEIKSILFNSPELNMEILESGKTSWDIVKDPDGEIEQDSVLVKEETSSFKLQLKKFSIKNARIKYSDNVGDMMISMEDFNMVLSGNFVEQSTSLNIKASVNSFNFSSQGISYMNDVRLDMKAGIAADLENFIFSFMDNELSFNDLSLSFNGKLDLSGEHPIVDMHFETLDNSFKSLISLIPTVYRNDFNEIKTSGMFSMDGIISGKYVEADSIFPDLQMNLKVESAKVSNPDFPASLDDINILLGFNIDGTNPDRSEIDIDKFTFNLAGSPFKANLYVRTPINNPHFKGMIKGRVNVSDFLNIIPIDNTSMNGNLEANLNFDFNLLDIEEEKYEKVLVEGSLILQEFEYVNPSIPVPIYVEDGELLFSSKYLNLKKLEMGLGRSDIHLIGRLDNYILYFLEDKDLFGSFSLNSSLLDLNELIVDIEEEQVQEVDSVTVSSIIIPGNIDFNLSAEVDKLLHGNMELTHLKGAVLVNNSRLILDGLNMRLLDGSLHATGEYNTTDTLNPSISMNLTTENLDIPTAFNSFNMVKALAPFAKNLNGKVSAKFFYSGLIDQKMNPIPMSITGGGKLQSEEVQILGSKAFDQIKSLVKLNKKYTNTFKDVNVSFGVQKGRVIIKPFNVNIGNIPVNFSGDHGLDNSLNYFVKMKIPREELGQQANQLIDQLSQQASLVGISFDQGEFIPVNFRITGSFGNPSVSLMATESMEAGGAIKEQIIEVLQKEVVEQKEKLEKEVREQASIEAEKILMQAEKEVENLKELANETAENVRREGYSTAEKIEDEASGNGWLAEKLAKKAADEVRKEADKQADKIISEATEKGEQILLEARKKAEEIK